MATKIKWEEADFKWNDNPYKWSDVQLVEEIVEAVAEGGGLVDVVEQLDPEKKKRFIKLICKIKGKETYSGQKTIHDDITVTAEDCELVIKEVLGIDLTVENIHV
jgi:hypothetical protein|tara:strand:+ start:811 stop:1125 length:315 start_codon:yes stop_codon:yes gene_type:complete